MVSSFLFGQSITVDGLVYKMEYELIDGEKANKLKSLYELKYRRAGFTDTLKKSEFLIELENPKKDSVTVTGDLMKFIEVVSGIQKGSFIVATLSLSGFVGSGIGLVYFGNESLFIVMYTDNESSSSLDLTNNSERERFEKIFKASLDMIL
jgi:hypothetical protein